MDPGSHVGFQINAKNTNLVEDHPMNISGRFGSNLFSGFREEDLNVKCTVIELDLYLIVHSIVLKFEKIWLSHTLNIIRKPKMSLFCKRKRDITKER